MPGGAARARKERDVPDVPGASRQRWRWPVATVLFALALLILVGGPAWVLLR